MYIFSIKEDVHHQVVLKTMCVCVWSYCRDFGNTNLQSIFQDPSQKTVSKVDHPNRLVFSQGFVGPVRFSLERLGLLPYFSQARLQLFPKTSGKGGLGFAVSCVLF